MRIYEFSLPYDDLFPVEVCVYENCISSFELIPGNRWWTPIGQKKQRDKYVKEAVAFDKSCTRETAERWYEANQKTGFHFVQYRHAGNYVGTELLKRFLCPYDFKAAAQTQLAAEKHFKGP